MSPGTWLSTPAQSKVTRRVCVERFLSWWPPRPPWECGIEPQEQGVRISPANGMNLSKGATVRSLVVQRTTPHSLSGGRTAGPSGQGEVSQGSHHSTARPGWEVSGHPWPGSSGTLCTRLLGLLV